MPPLGSFVSYRLWHRVFHLHIAAFEGSLGKPWFLERGLHVHSVIHHIRDKLRVRLRLVPSAHDAEPDVNVALLHERRNNRVQRPLMPGQRIWQARRELKSRTAIVKRKPKPRSDHPRAIARVVALDERYAISVCSDRRKIDR